MKKIITIVLCIFVIALIVIFVMGKNSPDTTEVKSVSEPTVFSTSSPEVIVPETVKLNIAEVAKHSTEADCHVIYNAKVYNVTKYLADNLHPAGKEAIIPLCGKDITLAFETRGQTPAKPHSDKAKNFLEKYYLGDLVK